MEEDFDNKIGFWIKNIPYIWKGGKTIFDSQRFYLIDSGENIVVFGKENKYVMLPNISSESKDEIFTNSYSIIPFQDDCNLPRQCFQIWLNSKGEKTSNEDIRIEGKPLGKSINDSYGIMSSPKDNIRIIYRFTSNSEIFENIKIYHTISNELKFYCNSIFRDSLFKKVAECIFSMKDPLSPYLTYEDINFQLPYHRINKECSVNYSTHRGQCKLFLGELQFLTKYIEKHTDTEIVIYPGGCPANHLWYLINFFPNIKFVSIDPEPCELYVEKFRNIHFKQKEWKDYIYLKANKKSKNNMRKYGIKIIGDEDPSKFAEYINSTDYRVYFIQDFMTISLSHHLNNVKNALYISDIRTQIKKPNMVYDIDIIWNLSQQYNWINILKPKAYLLKFRFPFDNIKEKIDFENIPQMIIKDFEFSKKIGIDFLENYKNGTLQYLDGTVNLQAYAPVSSTETRLEGTTLFTKDYGSASDYESKFVFYNILRSLGYFHNPLANRKLGFDHSADCALEYRIWKNYADKYNKKVSLKWIEGLIGITEQPLFSGNHGFRFKPLTMEKYKEDHKTLKYNTNRKKRKNTRG